MLRSLHALLLRGGLQDTLIRRKAVPAPTQRQLDGSAEVRESGVCRWGHGSRGQGEQGLFKFLSSKNTIYIYIYQIYQVYQILMGDRKKGLCPVGGVGKECCMRYAAAAAPSAGYLRCDSSMFLHAFVHVLACMWWWDSPGTCC